MYTLVFYRKDQEEYRDIWMAIDAQVMTDRQAYQDALFNTQLQASLTKTPLREDETETQRAAGLPPVRVQPWLVLYTLIESEHTSPAYCRPDTTYCFIMPGQEQIAADYAAHGAVCLTVQPKKTGRWFPPLSPLAPPPTDLRKAQTTDDRWGVYQGDT